MKNQDIEAEIVRRVEAELVEEPRQQPRQGSQRFSSFQFSFNQIPLWKKIILAISVICIVGLIISFLGVFILGFLALGLAIYWMRAVLKNPLFAALTLAIVLIGYQYYKQ